jgi:site-specific recombinase XerD
MYYQRSAECLRNAVDMGRITIRDKQLIEEFITEQDAKGISPSRHHKLVKLIVGNREFHPAFVDCTNADVLRAVSKIRYVKRKPRRNEKRAAEDMPLTTQNTISDRTRLLKRFFIWIIENGYNSYLDAKKIMGIKPPAFKRDCIQAADILTEDEVLSFLNACYTSRDKALFNVLFEGALRVGDIGNLRFQDLLITDNVCRLKTSGKTGVLRTIPLFSSRAYLSQWINVYPGEVTPDKFVFVKNNGQPLTHAGIATLTRKIAVRAGITKKVYPHLFRHTRISYWTREGLDEAKIKLLAWGSQNTQMMGVYSHLTVDDLEKSLAEMQGIEMPTSGHADTQSHKRPLKPIQCSHCGSINPPGSMYCGVCYYPLTRDSEEEIIRLAGIIKDKLLSNPEAFAAMLCPEKR